MPITIHKQTARSMPAANAEGRVDSASSAMPSCAPVADDVLSREPLTGIDAVAGTLISGPCPARTAALATEPMPDLTVSFRRFELRYERDVQLGEIAGVAVRRAQVRSFVGARNNFLDASALQTVEVEFGTLKREQFDALHAEFGGRSQVQWDAGRSYRAIDFLPPLVQALVNVDLQVEPLQPIPGTEDWSTLRGGKDVRLNMTSNCHGTAYEVMRAYQAHKLSLRLFAGDTLATDDLNFGSSPLLTKLAELDFTCDSPGSGLRPGDVVQFFEPDQAVMSNLLHSAIYLGGGLFFEKPDTETVTHDSPWRLATADMIVEPLRSLLGSEPRIEALRPCATLPDPEIVYGNEHNRNNARDWANRRGHGLGFDLVGLLEFGMGGGIIGDYFGAISDHRIELDADGRGRLDA